MPLPALLVKLSMQTFECVSFLPVSIACCQILTVIILSNLFNESIKSSNKAVSLLQMSCSGYGNWPSVINIVDIPNPGNNNNVQTDMGVVLLFRFARIVRL